jgi:two-component system, response regulator
MGAFEKSKLVNQILVARDGKEALDLLFTTGQHAGRDPNQFLEAVLLDLNLPKVNGLEVLRRMRADPCTRRLPIVVLTSSNQEMELIASYDLGANGFARKAIDFSWFRRSRARAQPLLARPQ